MREKRMLFWQKALKSIAYGDFQSSRIFRFWNWNGKAMSAQQDDGFNHKTWRNLVKDQGDLSPNLMYMYMYMYVYIYIYMCM